MVAITFYKTFALESTHCTGQKNPQQVSTFQTRNRILGCMGVIGMIWNFLSTHDPTSVLVAVPGGMRHTGGILMRSTCITSFLSPHPNKDHLSDPFFLYSNDKNKPPVSQVMPPFPLQFGCVVLHRVPRELLGTAYRCQRQSDHGLCWSPWPSSFKPLI